MRTVALLGLTMSVGLAQADTLYNNGPAVNANGLRIFSDVQGYAAGTTFDAGIADDFTVSAPGGWKIESLDLFGYTDQNTPSQGGVSLFTFQSVTWSIVRGDVNAGEVIASDTTFVTNGGVLGYNVPTSDLGSKRQAIFDIKANIPDLELDPGHYWLTWSYTTTAFNPSQTPVDGAPSGNGMGRFRTSVFSDRGTAFPFQLNGVVISSVPEPATLTSLLAGLGALGAVSRRRRGLPSAPALQTA